MTGEPASGRRRAVLAAGASALLAGCTVPSLGPGRTAFDGDVTIPPGEFHDVSLSLSAERTVVSELAVEAGPNVDVFLLDAEGFDAYRDGDPIEPTYLSVLDVSGGFAERTVPAGEYAAVFDNTDRGEARPDGERVRGTVTVTVEPPD